MTKRRLFTYRVWFTKFPNSYFVVWASNKQMAIEQAKQLCRAFPTAVKRMRLVVLKTERL